LIYIRLREFISNVSSKEVLQIFNSENENIFSYCFSLISTVVSFTILCVRVFGS
jgi:hypothetical protein